MSLDESASSNLDNSQLVRYIYQSFPNEHRIALLELLWLLPGDSLTDIQHKESDDLQVTNIKELPSTVNCRVIFESSFDLKSSFEKAVQSKSQYKTSILNVTHSLNKLKQVKALLRQRNASTTAAASITSEMDRSELSNEIIRLKLLLNYYIQVRSLAESEYDEAIEFIDEHESFHSIYSMVLKWIDRFIQRFKSAPDRPIIKIASAITIGSFILQKKLHSLRNRIIPKPECALPIPLVLMIKVVVQTSYLIIYYNSSVTSLQELSKSGLISNTLTLRVTDDKTSTKLKIQSALYLLTQLEHQFLFKPNMHQVGRSSIEEKLFDFCFIATTTVKYFMHSIQRSLSLLGKQYSMSGGMLHDIPLLRECMTRWDNSNAVFFNIRMGFEAAAEVLVSCKPHLRCLTNLKDLAAYAPSECNSAAEYHSDGLAKSKCNLKIFSSSEKSSKYVLRIPSSYNSMIPYIYICEADINSLIITMADVQKEWYKGIWNIKTNIESFSTLKTSLKLLFTSPPKVFDDEKQKEFIEYTEQLAKVKETGTLHNYGEWTLWIRSDLYAIIVDGHRDSGYYSKSKYSNAYNDMTYLENTNQFICQIRTFIEKGGQHVVSTGNDSDNARLTLAKFLSEPSRNWSIWLINLILLDLIEMKWINWDQFMFMHPMKGGSVGDKKLPEIQHFSTLIAMNWLKLVWPSGDRIEIVAVNEIETNYGAGSDIEYLSMIDHLETYYRDEVIETLLFKRLCDVESWDYSVACSIPEFINDDVNKLHPSFRIMRQTISSYQKNSNSTAAASTAEIQSDLNNQSNTLEYDSRDRYRCMCQMKQFVENIIKNNSITSEEINFWQEQLLTFESEIQNLNRKLSYDPRNDFYCTPPHR